METELNNTSLNLTAISEPQIDANHTEGAVNETICEEHQIRLENEETGQVLCYCEANFTDFRGQLQCNETYDPFDSNSFPFDEFHKG